MTVGDINRTVGPGTILFIPRGVIHRFKNVGTTIGRMLDWSLPGGQDHYFRAISDLAASDGFTGEKAMVPNSKFHNSKITERVESPILILYPCEASPSSCSPSAPIRWHVGCTLTHGSTSRFPGPWARVRRQSFRPGRHPSGIIATSFRCARSPLKEPPGCSTTGSEPPDLE